MAHDVTAVDHRHLDAALHRAGDLRLRLHPPLWHGGHRAGALTARPGQPEHNLSTGFRLTPGDRCASAFHHRVRRASPFG
jgi:hypothetical protein